MRLLLVLSLILAGALFSMNCTSDAKALNIEVLSAPVPVTTQGKTLLVYELYLVNATDADATITRLAVADAAKPEAELLAYDGASLEKAIVVLNKDIRQEKDKDLFMVSKELESVKIEPGRLITMKKGNSALIYMWVELEGAAPEMLFNKVTVNGAVENCAVEVSGRKPILIAAPLKGRMWLTSGAPGPHSYHRRALLPIYGKFYGAQRFAVDFVIIDDAGAIASGDVNENRNHHCFGKEIHSVAEGTVTSILDGMPENIAGKMPDVKNANELEGNHIVVDIGGGNYVFYAHLQPGSLRVKPGDKVAKGQVLALIGNTGHSDAPHLHIHIMDGPDPVRSEGLPFLYESFELIGKVTGEANEAGNVLQWERAATPVAMKDVMPLQDDVVNFE